MNIDDVKYKNIIQEEEEEEERKNNNNNNSSTPRKATSKLSINTTYENILIMIEI